MGLDMYLSAKRRIVAIEPKANVLAVVGESDDLNTEHGTYIGGWQHMSDEDRARYQNTLVAASLDKIAQCPESPSLTVRKYGDTIIVSAHAVYWRKANSIHAWFVDNCQGGVDECQDTPITVDQLTALRDTCKTALAAYQSGDLETAGKTLTPRAGFFFGPTNIDEWWKDDVEHTIESIDRVLQAYDPATMTLEYNSSW